MAHFINNKKNWNIRENRLDNTRIAVRVEVKKQGHNVFLQPTDKIIFLKPGSVLHKLPEAVKVISAEGEVITATGAFWVTAETIDPYHCVTDLF